LSYRRKIINYIIFNILYVVVIQIYNKI